MVWVLREAREEVWGLGVTLPEFTPGPHDDCVTLDKTFLACPCPRLHNGDDDSVTGLLHTLGHGEQAWHPVGTQ